MALVRLNSVLDDVMTLGPGPALGVWSQGCDRACPGCASEHTWGPSGVTARTADVAAWMQASGRRYITISGGEPMDQAPAFADLLDEARAGGDWIVTCYSGYQLECLLRDIRPGTRVLLDRLDLLIDGPFLQARHAPLLWRGSSNQRIHDLSGRVTLPAADRSVGVMPVFGSDGSFELVGVYPEPQLLERLVEELGTPVLISDTHRTFPFPILEED